jgi:hypothetical protein
MSFAGSSPLVREPHGGIQLIARSIRMTISRGWRVFCGITLRAMNFIALRSSDSGKMRRFAPLKAKEYEPAVSAD